MLPSRTVGRKTTWHVAVAAIVVSGQEYVILDQTQRKVEVAYGSSLILRCLLWTEASERFRVSWYFNPNGSSLDDAYNISDEIFIIPAEASTAITKPGLRDGARGTEVTRSLSNVTHTNTGWYFCKVTIEIPIHARRNSSGTKVVVTESIMEMYPSLVTRKQAPRPEEPPPINWWMWILFGVSAFILIVLQVMFVLLRRRCRRSRAEDPVYANTRPVANKHPSPRPRVQQPKDPKTLPSSQKLWTPSPGRRYDEGKRRYKE
ncbi:uncharacterized protein LOC120790618 isoform X2 [Xiphias gladius]|uniref:uncharacterized protein LOC120790618 isoform X2 n=1 Tax=Xiphias gladius TaxID=8245 RepID=UPI001A980FDD|nr:uncharacterized protein LOC120790618 isoform X2 [Xiphias gladius]